MKKSLLALAVMGAFAGAAQAQVTLYGLIDTGIVVADDGAERTTTLGSGIGGAPRWGIKGSEDLGNGLKGHFVLEQGFDSDSGDAANAGRAFHRLSYLGLEGGFGTLRLGRQDTAMKTIMGKMDPFGAAGMANAHDYFLGGVDQRRPNQVSYLSPKMGGLQGGVHYNFGEARGDSSANSIVGLHVAYTNGPIGAFVGYENIDTTATAVDTEQKDLIVGATYDFGIAKLHAAYGDRSVDAVGGDIESGMLGVSAKVGGSGKVMANYIAVQRDTADADTDVLALGYNHSLSKRTTIVARYVRSDNDTNANLGTAVGNAFANGETASGFGLGIQHKF